MKEPWGVTESLPALVVAIKVVHGLVRVPVWEIVQEDALIHAKVALVHVVLNVKVIV